MANGFVTSAPSGLHGSLTQEGGGIWGQRFTAPGSGTIQITQIGIRCWGNGTSDVRFAIFTDDATNNRPETMVSGSGSDEFADVPAASTHAYATYSTPPQLTGGTAYWLVAFASNSAMIYDRGTTTDAVNVRGDNSGGYPTWPAGDEWHSFPAGSATADCGIYAVYSTDVQVPTGTSGGLVVGSETSYVGEGFVGSIEAAGSSGTVYPVTRTSELLAQDAALRAVVRARLLGDALALAEDGLAESAYAVLLNEALALADEARSGTVRNRVALDTFALVDEQIAAVIGGGQIYVRTPFDTTGVVDELKRTWQAVRILGDTLTLSDEARLHRALERAVSEAFAPSDEALRWTLRNRIMQEAVEAGDDKQRIVAWQRQRDEAFTLADALVFHANRVRLSDETLSLVDSFIRQGSSSATLTDGIVLQDGALAPTVRPRLATDLATTVDELRFSRMHGRVIAELLTVDDKRNWLLYLSRLDAVNVSDSAVAVRSLVRALTEALTLGDSFIAAAAGVRVRVAEDAIEIDDGAVRVLIARRRVGDDVVLADPVIATSAGLRVRDMVDALGVTDTALAGAARGRVVQDLVTALYDQSVKGAARWRVLADALDPRDFTLKMLARTILLADTLDFDDGQINATLSVRALWDALELTDAYTKAVADALANVLDVRIVIDALRSPVALGSYNPVVLGVARAPVLGGYN